MKYLLLKNQKDIWSEISFYNSTCKGFFKKYIYLKIHLIKFE